MAKSQQAFNKGEKEKSKLKKRKDKALRKEERKANAKNNANEMFAYVDENGNLTSTPPDPLRKSKVIAENIQIGVPKRDDSESKNAVRVGIVTFFNESKGFGFIKDLQTQESVFTHINGHIDNIKENNKVTFLVEKGKKGLNAFDVKLFKQ